MEFYKLFKRVVGIRSARMKLAMVAAARAVGMRYVGVFIDPVMACNLRCRMCYFSDDAKRPKPCAPMTREYIDSLRKPLLRKALKMQIGCSTEPTLYQDVPALIRAAKEEGVPYVEMTTNGQLITLEKLREWTAAGLDGITLSLHGTTQKTYEFLMQGARFDRLRELVEVFREIRKEKPEFKVRINYTLNNLNKNELAGLWDLFDGVRIDVLQVRPVQKLGDTAYNDFEIDDHADLMSRIINPMREECERRGVTSLMPGEDNIEKVNKKTSALLKTIEDLTYCFVTPETCYRPDFEPAKEGIRKYQRRSGMARKLRSTLLRPGANAETADANTTKKLNYQ